MTGYARAEGHDSHHSWVWEAKSVNGRNLELRCRVPSGYDFLDSAARDLAARFLKRGNVQISLTQTRLSDGQAVRLNRDLLVQILEIIDDLSPQHPGVTMARWDGLLSIKGVLEQADGHEPQDEAALAGRDAALKASLETVLSLLAEMRQSEGGRIAAVLLDQLDQMAILSERAGQCASLRPDAVRERLRAQVAAVLEGGHALPEDRIAQEVAMIAVKADVREELDRLRSHITAARQMIAEGGAVGRKLDFLSQEFNREANTLCSKSSDVDLTRIGLDLKAVIDQFREQVQNIE